MLVRNKKPKRPSASSMKRPASNPLRMDPTRTTTLRLKATRAVRRKFALLKGLLVKLVVGEDAFGLLLGRQSRDMSRMMTNSFCPTGPGGGVDPSCSPKGQGPETSSSILQKGVERVVAKMMETSEDRPIFGGGRMMSIAKVRERVERQYSPTREAFDAAVLQMWREGKIELERGSFGGSDEAENMKHSEGGIPGISGKLVWIQEKKPTANCQPGQMREAGGKCGLGLKAGSTDMSRMMTNAFCPTGPGGGIDPTCSPAAGGSPTSSLTKENAQETFQRVTEELFGKDRRYEGDTRVVGLPGGRFIETKVKVDYFKPHPKVRVDFGVKGRETDFTSDKLEPGTIDLMRKLKETVTAYRRAGFKIEVAAADSRRREFYAKSLGRMGLRLEFEGTGPSGFQVWNVENCNPGQMREAGGQCGPGIGVSIPRNEMPQIRGEDFQEFLKYVRDKGIDLTHKTVTADELSPTQSEFRQERVDAIPYSKLRDPILVSRDLYILDGTHRWVKHWQADRKAEVPVTVLDLDLRPALELMRAFPKAKFVENVFCATGEGGGVDPTCSPRSYGDTIAIHETDTVSIIPGSKNVAEMSRSEFEKLPLVYRGTRGNSTTEGHVFVTTDRATAASHGKVEVYRLRPGTKVYIDPEVSEDVEGQGHSLSGINSLTYGKSAVVHVSDLVTWLGRTRARTPTTNRFRFMSSPQKLEEFQRWLRQQFKSVLLGKSDEELWAEFARQGYLKGAGRAFDDVNRIKRWSPGAGDFYEGSRRQFLQSSFGRPESVDKLKLLAGRTFTDLANVTEDMAARMSRTLMDGLSRGANPRELVDSLVDDLDVSEARAETIARTEIIRAHSEGSLDAMEQMGVTEVGAAVEWSTAGDLRVCPKCSALNGVVLKIEEAHGIIPLHPQCRCAWIPANVGESQEKQIRSKKAIEAAFEESGIDPPELDDVRPRPLIEPTKNVFCPTGEGGGVDPTCSPGPKEIHTKLDSIEKELVGLKKERGVFLSKDGRILADKSGKRTVVKFDDKEDWVSEAKGGIFTHSHGNSLLGFSPDDIISGAAFGVSEIRAVGPEVTFVAREPATGWPKEKELKRALGSSSHQRWKVESGYLDDKGLPTEKAERMGYAGAALVSGFGRQYREFFRDQLSKLGIQYLEIPRHPTKNEFTSLESIVRFWQSPTENVFCATGPGGGVDPTCSPGMSEGIKLYTKDPITSKKISYVSAAVFRGKGVEDAQVQAGASDEQVAVARQLTEKIRESPIVTTPVYRSVSFSADEDRKAQLALKEKLDSAAVGQSLTLDRISSFTADRGQLAHYSSKEYHGEDRPHQYEIVLQGPHRSLATDTHSGMSHSEFITQGNFRVTSVSQRAGVKVIALSQDIR